MAKTEKKFRVVRLALSNDAYSNLESLSKALKVSRSRVITILLDMNQCPLEIMERIAAHLDAKQTLQIRREEMTEADWRDIIKKASEEIDEGENQCQ